MGIFYDKFVMESAVDDAIQTTDDVGVDLDAIEKNIMGDDGIEAHRDEVEAAEEGMIGDPVDEAVIIMYESEYNFNQLMKCIGVAELNEVSMGRDFILEGVNLKEFFKNAGAAFVKMFERITEVFKSAVSKLGASMSKDKDLIDKHYNEIKAGYMNGNWSFKDVYDMKALKAGSEKTPNRSAYEALAKNSKSAIDLAKNGQKWDLAEDENLKNSVIASRVSGLDIKDQNNPANAMRDALDKMSFVKVNYEGNAPIDTIVEVLKNAPDMKKIRQEYDILKGNYKDLLKELKRMEADVSKGDSEAEANAKSVAVAYISAHRFEKNLQNIMFTNCIKACKIMRIQARRMALVWQRLGVDHKVDEKHEKPKGLGAPATPKAESAFMNINII